MVQVRDLQWSEASLCMLQSIPAIPFQDTPKKKVPMCARLMTYKLLFLARMNDFCW